ncbi:MULTISPECIES: CynX/NimT family MFS transporter [Marinomonas]|jgi:MFS transporter, CP family, cyanate transporter|uniref:CynX/NimT family MFS transporter n=1 Tax=Marinomonas foliarum TaxID=491950 RepID=A0ABX7IRH4_9GAMM|nr:MULTISPECIES: CynX/NimT family MFS transporter [Marinomonas]QRV24534.1 CynX/NimT family MFS transporter [Marinomonas foliarum]UTV98203.1 CynX/NimT family MFS transporter [Marinomonas rhizomae]
MLDTKNKWNTIALVAGILFIAVNLRLPFTSIAPVLPLIQSDFGLSSSAVGLLTSLPLLAFAAFSPLSAPVARKFGLERTLFAAMTIISLGILLRSTGSVWALYLGTILIGTGIALGNVLLPGLVKRDLSANVASMTGAYSITMGAAGAIGSAIMIPLTQVWGWNIALTLLIAAPLFALIVWLPQLKKHEPVSLSNPKKSATVAVWKSPLAWQVTLFMGLNAMPFYVAVGWLPTILMDNGISATEAGSVHGTLQLATAIPGLILAATLRRLKDQKLAAVTTSLLVALSFIGLIYAPEFAILWAALLGFGSGACMMLGLTFVVLRTQNAGDAAALSGMAQCVGYLMAAAGPLLLGQVHDWTGGWTAPLLITAAIAVAGACTGMMAGRNVHLEPAPSMR